MHDFPWMADGYPLGAVAHVSRHEATKISWAKLARILIPTISTIRFNNIRTSKKGSVAVTLWRMLREH
jgi:hypothetical protein